MPSIVRPDLPAAAVLLVPAALALGCVDQPVCLTPAGSMVPAQRLSELGVYQDAGHTPAPGYLPYTVRVPLYSDEASKHRLLHLPAGTQLHATADSWELPLGTTLVKTFYYPVDARSPDRGEQIVETRFLVFGADGVSFATYLWNSDQTDAVCSGGNHDIPTRFIDGMGSARSDYFHQPGTSQCGSCHNSRALGLRTRQLDVDGAFEDGTGNQIEHLVAAGVLAGAPAVRGGLADPQGTAPLADRARSYLDANCGHCHAPEQAAGSTGVFLDWEHSGPGQLPLCRATAAVEGRDRVIVPGHPEQSELLARMRSGDAFVRMPRGPTHIPDQAGIAVLSAWIAAMSPQECP